MYIKKNTISFILAVVALILLLVDTCNKSKIVPEKQEIKSKEYIPKKPEVEKELLAEIQSEGDWVLIVG